MTLNAADFLCRLIQKIHQCLLAQSLTFRSAYFVFYSLFNTFILSFFLHFRKFFGMTLPSDVRSARSATSEKYAIALQEWKRSPSFNGMSRHFVEDVHGTFRRNFSQVKKAASVARSAETVDAAKSQHIFHKFSGFVAQLEHHHRLEDEYFFPTMRKQSPEKAADFDVLERDHAQLHPLEELVADTKALLTDRLGAVVDFVEFLEDHLNREEMLVVPLMLAS